MLFCQKSHFEVCWRWSQVASLWSFQNLVTIHHCPSVNQTRGSVFWFTGAQSCQTPPQRLTSAMLLHESWVSSPKVYFESVNMVTLLILHKLLSDQP